MMCFDTPAGKFRILLNGCPTNFELHYGEPAHFKTESGDEIISSNSYVACINIENFSVYDIISGVMEDPILHYAGCCAGMESMMCNQNHLIFELSTPYTADHEAGEKTPFLPYESHSFNPHGYALRIIDTPSKYTAYPMQKEIGFIIAWAFTDKPVWSTQAVDLLPQSCFISATTPM